MIARYTRRCHPISTTTTTTTTQTAALSVVNTVDESRVTLISAGMYRVSHVTSFSARRPLNFPQSPPTPSRTQCTNHGSKSWYFRAVCASLLEYRAHLDAYPLRDRAYHMLLPPVCLIDRRCSRLSSAPTADFASSLRQGS